VSYHIGPILPEFINAERYQSLKFDVKAAKKYAHRTLMVTKIALIMVINNLGMSEMYMHKYLIILHKA